jgi:PAS domain S-box-containing protein
VTAESLAEIVNMSHEFAIGLAEHFDVLHRVSRGDLAARVSGSSQVELLGSLKEVTNQMIASVSDEITERQQAEEKLEDSLDYLDRIINGMYEGLVVIDRNFIIKDVNQRFLTENKSTREDTIGQPCHQTTHKTDQPCSGSEHPCPVKEVFDTGKPVRVEHIHKNDRGERLFVELYAFPLFDRDGNIDRVVELSNDITERKRAQKTIQESEQWLRTILDSTQTGIVIIDEENHQIVDANPAALKMIGAPIDQLVGHVCHHHICPADKNKCPITDLGQTIDNSERALLTPEGKSITILKTVVPIMLNGRKHLLESFIDIRELKEAEEEKKRLEANLQRAEKMEVVGTLAGGVAHDLNNVLGGLVSYPDLLLMELPEDSPLRKPILTIQESGQKAAAIVQHRVFVIT